MHTLTNQNRKITSLDMHFDLFFLIAQEFQEKNNILEYWRIFNGLKSSSK